MGAGELICQACGAHWYSAAAEQMVARAAPCPSCQACPLIIGGARNGDMDPVGEGEDGP